MSLNPLKIASDGYLKRTTKAVLVIAVSGYLNFGATPPPVSSGGGSSEKKNTFYTDDNQKIERQIRDDDDIIQIIKIFIQCQR